MKKPPSKVAHNRTSIKSLWSPRQPVVSKEFILSQEIKKSLVHCGDKNFQLAWSFMVWNGNMNPDSSLSFWKITHKKCQACELWNLKLKYLVHGIICTILYLHWKCWIVVLWSEINYVSIKEEFYLKNGILLPKLFWPTVRKIRFLKKRK